jgi:hypothetical protein
MMGGTLSPTSLIFFGGLAFEWLGQTRGEDSESKPALSSFGRRAEEKWDTEDSVPPEDDLIISSLRLCRWSLASGREV